MTQNLTKDAEKLLSVIYKIYLERIKHGITIDVAKHFHCTRFEQNDLKNHPKLITYEYDEIQFLLNELVENELIKKYIGGSFMLENKAIAYMQNRSKNKIKELISLIK